MTGFKDPEFKGINFKKIMVVAMFSDLANRKTFEDEVVSAFDDEGYKAVSSLTIFSPTRDYTNEEFATKLSDNQIEGVLILSLQDAYSTQSYVPENKQYNTKGQGTLLGDYYYYKSTTKVETTGGYYVSKPVVNFESALFATENSKLAWIATSTTKGNAFAKIGNLAASLGRNIIENLIEEGLVR